MSDPVPPSSTARFKLPPSTAAAGAQAVRAFVKLVAVLERLLPLVRRVTTGVRIYAWSGFGAAATFVLAILLVSPPHALNTALALIIFAAVLAIPAVILLLFHGALREVLELPDWLRSSPELARTHAAELAELTGLSRGTIDGDVPKRGFGRDLWRSGRLLLEAHGDLPEYGSALRLISIPFLIAVGISFVVVFFEWLVGMPLLLVALVVSFAT